LQPSPQGAVGSSRTSHDRDLARKTTDGLSYIWRQFLDVGGAKLVTDFHSDRIYAFAESRDGKRMAVARGASTSNVVMIKDVK
jgi:hypothetical protein